MGSKTEYFVTRKETCPKCKGDKMIKRYVGYFPKPPIEEMCYCDGCNGKGFVENFVPLKGALVELGYVPMTLRDLTEQEHQEVSDFMREFFSDMHKKFYPNEEFTLIDKKSSIIADGLNNEKVMQT